MRFARRRDEPRLALATGKQVRDVGNVDWNRKQTSTKQRHAAGMIALRCTQACAFTAADSGIVLHKNNAEFVLDGMNNAMIK